MNEVLSPKGWVFLQDVVQYYLKNATRCNLFSLCQDIANAVLPKIMQCRFLRLCRPYEKHCMYCWLHSDLLSRAFCWLFHVNGICLIIYNQCQCSEFKACLAVLDFLSCSVTFMPVSVAEYITFC